MTMDDRPHALSDGLVLLGDADNAGIIHRAAADAVEAVIVERG